MNGRPARAYRLTWVQRCANTVYTLMTRCGLGAQYRHLLTVVGRQTGLPRTTPVDVMSYAGSQWLVAPYGAVNWVRNLRASGQGMLRRGSRCHTFRAVEADTRTAVPVIRQYIEQVPITRSYWGVGPDATDEELAQKAARHPVFELTRIDRP